MSNHLLFLFLLFFLHSSPSSADAIYHFCDATGNYTATSTYVTNLNRALSFLPVNASLSSGFAKSTFGSIPNEVTALALCRGDTNSSACRSCLDTATQDVTQLCPYYKAATIYYDLCLLRYSNEFFFSTTNNSHEVIVWNISDITGYGTNTTLFNSVLNTLLTGMADWAANHSTRRFATGEMNIIDATPALYVLVQCTPDMSSRQCHGCLHDLIDQMLTDFGGRQGGLIIGDRCNLRYEIYKFYGFSMVTSSSHATMSPPMVPRSPLPPSGGKSKVWIIVTTTSAALLCSFSFLCFLLIKRQRRAGVGKRKLDDRQPHGIETEASRLWKNEESYSMILLYKFSQVADATNNFSPENKLGEGGFGPVYKGQLPEGLEIAAKRLSARSGQGQEEFKNEIQVIAKLQHRNLVSLIGCCIEGEEKILIYEYMPNRSLDFFLFDQTRGALLDWSKRIHIIDGIAQGLLYLHKHSRLRIIHKDLKASNILLDNDMNPKISDFGMARIFGSDVIQANTNRVVGTPGYMSPEYALEGHFSIKSDVFSFGVLLLEIVSGKVNASFHQYDNYLNLLSYAWNLWKEGKWYELIDTSAGKGYDKDVLTRCINVALMCVQENPADRPTMSTVIEVLNSESTDLPNPKKPAFFNLRTKTEAEDIETCSENDVTITIPHGL